jgi:hypothetical protein
MTAAPRRPRSVSEMPTKLTTDDLRHKVLAVREVATDEAQKLLKANTVRIVIASAVIVGVALSMAYLMGSRAAARSAARTAKHR